MLLRWVKRIDEKTYFENDKNDESKWCEYHDEKLVAKFIEIDRCNDTNGELEVLIQRTDGFYVKLTSVSVFGGNDKHNVDRLISHGGWNKDIKAKNFNKEKGNFIG